MVFSCRGYVKMSIDQSYRGKKRACLSSERLRKLNDELRFSRSEAIHFVALCVFGRSSVLYPISHGQMTAFEDATID